MMAAPFGSLALQLSSDLRIVTRISRGSDAQKKCHPLFLETVSDLTEHHS